MFFSFPLHGHQVEDCNLTAHEANRCTFWTSCTGVSWKCPFLCIVHNFGDSFLTEMRILVREVLHTGGEITLKMSYLRCSGFSFCQGYMSNKGRHYSVGDNALHMFHRHYRKGDWVMHILDKSNFCGRKTLFPLHYAWICAQFHHFAAPPGFRSNGHTRTSYSVKTTESVLFGVCFASLMFIYPEVECCMTYTNGNTTVLEAQQCTFWTLRYWFAETSIVVDNAWLCFQLDHLATYLGSWSFMQRDAINTETVLLTMSFAFVECNIGWRTKWIVAHSGQVALDSWKRLFLCITCNFEYS